MTYSTSGKLFESLTTPSYPSLPCFISPRIWCVFFFFVKEDGLFVSNHFFIFQDRTNIGSKNSVGTSKKLKSVHRKCSSCRPPKGSPNDWQTISDLCLHLFRVCRLLRCRKYRSLNNNLGRISFQSSRAASFSRRLVQGCICRWWLSPGVSWPHVKVRSSGSCIP